MGPWIRPIDVSVVLIMKATIQNWVPLCGHLEPPTPPAGVATTPSKLLSCQVYSSVSRAELWFYQIHFS